MTDADEAVEAAAKAMLPLYYDGSPEWAEQYWNSSHKAEHRGDCPKAEHKGPITCDRCVCDELRTYARAALTAASAHTGERMARAIEALLPEIEEAEIGHGGGSHDDECPTCAAIKEAGAALAAYRSARAPEPMAGAVEGWKLVPVEPTPAMLEAQFGQAGPRECYRAMLAVNPPPPDGWRGIETRPDKPIQVELFYANLVLRNEDGSVAADLPAYRDCRRELGFWDGRAWCELGTGHDCFEWERPPEHLPTHWRSLPSPPGEELGKD